VFYINSQRVKLTSKIHDEYEDFRTLPEALIKQQKDAAKARMKAKSTTIEEVLNDDENNDKTAMSQLIDSIPEKSTL
jgi:pleiotropic regulator 1